MLTVHAKSIVPPHQLGAALHHHQHHRRNPSAPTLSVQATNVPGLFSVGPRSAASQTAKAAREPRQHQPKHQPKPIAAPVPVTATASTLLATPPATPSPGPRGRKTAAAPASIPTTKSGKRSPSHSAQARRNKEHQPEPAAIPTPTSTERPATPPSAKPSPRPTHHRNNTAPSSPTVPMQQPATGKIARRRKNAKTAAATDDSKMLSRSAPQQQAIADWDTPLALDTSVLAALISGPRTAPLNKAPRFPFPDHSSAAYSPPPSPTPAAKHMRSPSAPFNGLFDMDDDLHMHHSKSVGSSPLISSARRVNLSASMSVPALLGVNSAAGFSTPADLDDAKFKWASSRFQTGPITRALPAPGL